MSERDDAVLVMVKRRVTVPPAPTGSSMNSLVKIGAVLTTRLSVAVFPVTPSLAMVAVIAVVVLVKVPGVAPAGTSSVTLNRQKPSEERLPPVRVRVPEAKSRVPPQAALGSVSLGAKPVSDPSGSIESLKEMPVAPLSRSRLLMVNSRVTVPPGATGSSMKDLLRNSTGTLSTAVATPIGTSGLRLGRSSRGAAGGKVLIPRQKGGGPGSRFWLQVE